MTATVTTSKLSHVPEFSPMTKATARAAKALAHLKPKDTLLVGVMEAYDTLWFSFDVIATQPVPISARYQYQDKDLLQRLDGEMVARTEGYPSWDARSWAKDHIPENFKVTDLNYSLRRVAATDISVLMARSAWGDSRIVFKDKDAENLFTYIYVRFMSQTHRAKVQAEYKLNGTVPEAPADYDEHPELPLSDYQRVAMQMALGQEAIALFMEQGTGKTPTAIARICLEAKRTRRGEMDGKKRMMRVLIVAPNAVRLNWETEFQRFATTPGKVCRIRGGKMRRVKLLTQAIKDDPECGFTAVIIGYDTLSNDHEIFSQVAWDLLVTDESHYYKNAKTNRWNAIASVRDVSARKMALTGTPIPNTLFDLQTQLEGLYEGGSGFQTVKGYRDFHGQFEDVGQVATGGHVSKLIGYNHVPWLQERLTRLSFRITTEDAGLNLPDKVYDIHEVEMTAKQKTLYEKVSTHLFAEVEADLAGATEKTLEVVCNNILVKLLRLSTITSGHIKFDGEKKAIQIDSKNPKIEATMDLLAENLKKDPNLKTVIFACWSPDLEALAKRMEADGIKFVDYKKEKDAGVHRFNNDPETRVIICNPASAGVGLNLLGYNPDNDINDSYCGHEIWFSQNWRMDLRIQGEDRAHRRGTKMPVRITDLTVIDSIDEEIRNRVVVKAQTAEAIQDISTILKRVLGIEADVNGVELQGANISEKEGAGS